ncbi:hypothetical protein G6F57_020851 [Rhizopus arrhizus]|nr:hypothetical protein G6F57_020851 [Rhizopus arrhizus]
MAYPSPPGDPQRQLRGIAAGERHRFCALLWKTLSHPALQRGRAYRPDRGFDRGHGVVLRNVLQGHAFHPNRAAGAGRLDGVRLRPVRILKCFQGLPGDCIVIIEKQWHKLARP